MDHRFPLGAYRVSLPALFAVLLALALLRSIPAIATGAAKVKKSDPVRGRNSVLLVKLRQPALEILDRRPRVAHRLAGVAQLLLEQGDLALPGSDLGGRRA
jgi:hypothetical protein